MKIMEQLERKMEHAKSKTYCFMKHILIPKKAEEAEKRQKKAEERLNKTLNQAGNDALEEFVRSMERVGKR